MKEFFKKFSDWFKAFWAKKSGKIICCSLAGVVVAGAVVGIVLGSTLGNGKDNGGNNGGETPSAVGRKVRSSFEQLEKSSEEDEWERNYFTTYEYEVGQNGDYSELEIQYRGNGDIYSKHLYEHKNLNSHGAYELEIDTWYSSADDWTTIRAVSYWKTEYEYDNLGRETSEEISYSNNQGASYNKDYKLTYTYVDNTNALKTEKSYYSFENGEYTYVEEYVFTYDENGIVTRCEYFEDNSEEYCYYSVFDSVDTENFSIKETEYEYDSETGLSKINSKYEYRYVDLTSLKELNSDKCVYESYTYFDEDENLSFVIEYDYVYDEDGDILSETSKRTDYEENEPSSVKFEKEVTVYTKL